jgi:hypothetical protein
VKQLLDLSVLTLIPIYAAIVIALFALADWLDLRFGGGDD